jgi:WhiB family redox-sensing transcriptional regulator
MSTSTAAAMPARDQSPDWPDDAAWRDGAACREADPELFFPDIRSARAQVMTAKLICRSCPVTTACLSWALASGQEHGIWGGLTEDERRRLNRRGRSWAAGRRPLLGGRAPDLGRPAPAPHEWS